jgi:hypothetical protein
MTGERDNGVSLACAGCGRSVDPGNRFCGHCGAAVLQVCGSCGKENPPGHRFCGGCGSSLEASADGSVPLPEPAGSPVSQPWVEAPSIEAGAETSEVVGVRTAPTAPPPVPPPPPPAPSPLAEGMDAVARERELQSLLAKANLLRLRAQIRDARRTLDIALELAHTLPTAASSPVHEMIGDMLAAEERWEPARDAYALANDADPSRASAERKLGEMILKAQDEAVLSKLGLSAPPPSADDVQDRLGLATFFSLVVPGAGQLWMRQWAKGSAFFVLFLLSLGFFLWTQGSLDAPAVPGKANRAQTNTVGTGYAAIVVAVLVYVVCLVDLATQSKRIQAKRRPNPVPAGKPEDWEV